eukprot:569895-Rhodomonas_salina.1
MRAQREETQAGENPMDQLMCIVVIMYNDYTVGGPGGWDAQPMNEFTAYEKVLNINPAEVDRYRDEDSLKKSCQTIRASVRIALL